MIDEEQKKRNGTRQNDDREDEILIEELDERLEFGGGVVDDFDEREHNLAAALSG